MVGRLTYLVDTNVWLEALLAQEKAPEAQTFLSSVEARHLAITEFSLYSLGVVLTRLNKTKVFEDFLSDTLEDSAVGRIRLDLADLKQLLAAQKEFQLDFDDAYQYIAAQRYDLILVSFDRDFDRTPRGRKTPAELIS
jgi:hypothetical protein